MWAYWTIPRATTGETPFSLTYGFDVVVPTEIGLPTYRVANYDDRENEEALRAELVLVEEKRDQAYLRMATLSKGSPNTSINE